MTLPADLMRPEVLVQPAYAVADATGLVKLDAMENPYAWPGELETAWLEALRGVELNRYPDAGGRAVVAAIRGAHGVPDTAGCLLGNGSDELIQILIAAVQGSGRPVLAPVPTFVMYEVLARAAGVPFVGVPLTSDFDLDGPALLNAVEVHRPALVFLACPNNPTGRQYDPDLVDAVALANPGVTVIDEAYAPFASHTFLPRAGAPAGLMVMRTLSKLGLAGLRLGYLAAAPEWIDALDRLRLPYNINSLTQRSALFALAHGSVLDAQAAVLREQRGVVSRALDALPGVLRVIPSDANFILFQVGAGRGQGVFNALRASGILIKNVGASGGVLRDHLRVTVGTPEQNRAFLAALEQALDAAG
ncbi:pyridoxal phosphate-dependent aminotransferase [Thioalkalivibrio paradoxus]|uniref:Histidinol-phosphate aminotransferase n=1 Tax=Thioalkalivibrio paradoxus ARh 1 TaxID=713585 RepID=W0DR16_9GAMM|nr:histidinol-phosphate transaminase [Thioalkalivibrio paradoxus]AHE99295.1 histidinol-phosphate aminotransferase [Thioalkalivibrio paradoxus ARh 1]